MTTVCRHRFNLHVVSNGKGTFDESYVLRTGHRGKAERRDVKWLGESST